MIDPNEIYSIQRRKDWTFIGTFVLGLILLASIVVVLSSNGFSGLLGFIIGWFIGYFFSY